MPHSYLVNDHRQSMKTITSGLNSIFPTRDRYGLSEDAFVFCNFGQLFKIDPEVFDTWMKILKRVPNSVLWLLRFPPDGEVNLRAEARKRGVRDVQLHFSDVAANEEHILRGTLADLFLDTSICNAATTACDILWMGTPMITVKGERMISRVASSILTSAGLPEMICNSLSEYEELAVELAEDSEKLFSYRRRLEKTRENSAAFDTERWVRNWEKGLQAVVKKLGDNQLPGDIFVSDDEPVSVEVEESLLGLGLDNSMIALQYAV